MYIVPIIVYAGGIIVKIKYGSELQFRVAET